jgi:ribosomal protein S18 acetylase RimI-like enzyme
MLQIRTMRFDDIPYALRLTDQERWGVTHRDLTRILKLDPKGSLVATEGSRRVALITTTRYGRKLAWIGNVIVDRNYRGVHIGQSLVHSAVEYLRKFNVEHVALYCFDENVKFYRRLGFVRDVPFARLRRKPIPLRSTSATTAAPQALPLRAVLSVDKKAFGADRSRLIRMVLRTEAAWYLGFSNGPSAKSYLMVKKYKELYELGPWVCISPPKAQPSEMLKLTLAKTTGKPIEVSCLRDHQAFGLFKKYGFRVMSHGYRMCYGRIPRIGELEANFALGFLDKG